MRDTANTDLAEYQQGMYSLQRYRQLLQLARIKPCVCQYYCLQLHLDWRNGLELFEPPPGRAGYNNAMCPEKSSTGADARW